MRPASRVRGALRIVKYAGTVITARSTSLSNSPVGEKRLARRFSSRGWNAEISGACTRDRRGPIGERPGPPGSPPMRNGKWRTVVPRLRGLYHDRFTRVRGALCVGRRRPLCLAPDVDGASPPHRHDRWPQAHRRRVADHHGTHPSRTRPANSWFRDRCRRLCSYKDDQTLTNLRARCRIKP